MMKSVKYIQMIMMALVMGLGLTSCMDDDWKAPSGDTPAYGNNTLQEKNVISIDELKTKYGITKDMINDTVRIDDGIQIKGVVTGNDAEGNIYNEIALQDETGGILVCIAQGGLCGQIQVGQEILIDLGGLYIGAYRSQPQIGVPYTSTSTSGAKSVYPSRIARAEWQTRFKLIGKPDAKKLVAKEFDYESLKGNETELYKYAGCLVKATGVGFAKADGKTTYAPKSEGASTGYGVMRAFKNMTTGKDYTTNEFGVRTSCYSDFAAEKLPEGKLTVTGILTCYKSQKKYNATAQILMRQQSDVQQMGE
ncbi:MAG: DUF5689 domain-containing protein [Prevotella sp.]|nr:DUF5689 domain-containing protein [Prevotella sp.]MDY5089598.1 DUF5689 domain-containing protein [Prevotella sp.]